MSEIKSISEFIKYSNYSSSDFKNGIDMFYLSLMDIFKEYVYFCKSHGFYIESRQLLGKYLTNNGFEKKRQSYGMAYKVYRGVSSRKEEIKGCSHFECCSSDRLNEKLTKILGKLDYCVEQLDDVINSYELNEEQDGYLDIELNQIHCAIGNIEKCIK